MQQEANSWLQGDEQKKYAPCNNHAVILPAGYIIFSHVDPHSKLIKRKSKANAIEQGYEKLGAGAAKHEREEARCRKDKETIREVMDMQALSPFNVIPGPIDANHPGGDEREHARKRNRERQHHVQPALLLLNFFFNQCLDFAYGAHRVLTYRSSRFHVIRSNAREGQEYKHSGVKTLRPDDFIDSEGFSPSYSPAEVTA